MAVIGRGSISSLLVPDARKLYIEVGEERPLEFEAVFNVDTMPWNSVKDLQMSGLGTMPAKAEGAQFTLDQPIMGGTATYLANPYGIAVEFTYEGWRDELYGAFQETYREMARASRNRQEVDAFAVLNDAFTGNTYT
ncbi:MAG TPA: hypothetical protein VMU39_27500, partial [Solirubrobacteraceae bacterium]|nr:hypothetical protein [Solirubrobacteraceae bacterium]